MYNKDYTLVACINVANKRELKIALLHDLSLLSVGMKMPFTAILIVTWTATTFIAGDLHDVICPLVIILEHSTVKTIEGSGLE